MSLENNNKTIRNLILAAKNELNKSCVGESYVDAQIFMMKAVNMSKTEILINPDYELNEEQLADFRNMVEKRKSGIPSKYIIGKCEFMGYDFFVDENVLIPRADTEVLVEKVLEFSKENNFKNILDMCTGSGCIAISLVLNGIEKAVGADISKGALNIAEKNAEYNNVKNKTEFIHSNLFENIGGVFDAIVSNPPYIPREDIKSLMREVKDHEPLSALDGGDDGLDFYRKITEESRKYLKSGGMLFYEIGYNQSKDLHNIMEENGFEKITTVKDYAGLDRVVFGTKTER